MPARLIKIKYITIRAEKIASPITALHLSGYYSFGVIWNKALLFY